MDVPISEMHRSRSPTKRSYGRTPLSRSIISPAKRSKRRLSGIRTRSASLNSGVRNDILAATNSMRSKANTVIKRASFSSPFHKKHAKRNQTTPTSSVNVRKSNY